MKIKLLFDYNLLVLLLEHAYMVFPTTFIVKNRNLWEPLFTSLEHKGIHSTVDKSEAACSGKLENSKILLF